MKRPKQQTGPLSFLNFFSRKPKSEPRSEKPVEAWPKEEVAITLTPSEHPEQELSVRAEEGGDIRVSGAEKGEGGGSPAADEVDAKGAVTGECMGRVSSRSTGVLSLSSSSQEQLLDEHLEECPLCLLSQPRCHFPRLTSCSHRACSDCLRQYLRIEISESRVGIACPQCSETLAPLDVRAILNDQSLLERFEEYQLRRFLASDPDTRWCPAPDCSYAVIAYGCAECPKLICGRKGCDTEFCYHCRQLWHPNQTCDQARRLRARHNSGGNDASMLYIFNEEPDRHVRESRQGMLAQERQEESGSVHLRMAAGTEGWQAEIQTGVDGMQCEAGIQWGDLVQNMPLEDYVIPSALCCQCPELHSILSNNSHSMTNSE